jgi:Demerecviridae HNH endonuclease
MLTLERLKSALRYKPDEGIFIWLEGGGRKRKGERAGLTHSNGYRYLNIDGKRYLESRLAVFYMTGNWPLAEVDHKDRNPSNNRWENLRECTPSQNRANARTGKKTINSDLPQGVSRGKGRIFAQCKVRRKNYNLGFFDTVEDAKDAYNAFSKAQFGEFR